MLAATGSEFQLATNEFHMRKANISERIRAQHITKNAGLHINEIVFLQRLFGHTKWESGSATMRLRPQSRRQPQQAFQVRRMIQLYWNHQMYTRLSRPKR
jgi:hypothetical protein